VEASLLAKMEANPTSIDQTATDRSGDYYQINQQCLSKPSLFTPTLTF